MKIITLLNLCFIFTINASDFSPFEIVGTYKSFDEMAVVIVKKIMTVRQTLFDRAQYKYLVDMKVDAGPCMEMYGDEREVISEDKKLRYNGSWKPVEYLLANSKGDSDYDGDVYVNDIDFLAKKTTSKSGIIKYSFDLSIDISHNPDTDGEADESKVEFKKCYDATKTS